jgi:hypothetical protein
VLDTLPSQAGVQEILQTILSGQPEASIIDQGGFFRGKENQQVVQTMLELSNIPVDTGAERARNELIYYDSEHEIQVMSSAGDHRGGYSFRPYVPQNVNRHQSGAFWDMQHTTGSDLKVNPRTVAILTLSKFSIMRDLLQSAWRLRELEQSQSVRLVLPRDDLKVISKVLATEFGDGFAISENATHVPLEKILLYLAIHEAHKAGELNYRSVKASQRAVIVESIFDTLVDPHAFGPEVAAAFEQIKPFFSNPRGVNPYERYGVPIVKIGTMDFLRNEIARILEPVQQVFANLVHLQGQFEQALDRMSAILRRYVVTPLRQEVEAEEEMEIETELESEQEQALEREIEVSELDSAYQKALIQWQKEAFLRGSFIDQPTRAENLPLERISLEQVSSLSPVMPLGDIFHRGGLDSYSTFFDPSLYGSLNLFPVFQTTDIAHDRPFTPFGVYQGFIDFVLVTLNEDLCTPHSFVMITRDEALDQLGNWLLEDRSQRQSPLGGRASLIYQFGNGVIRTTSNYIQGIGGIEHLEENLRNLESTQRFKTLLVQVKFLSGRVHYTEEERRYLRDWMVSTQRRSDLLTFFQDHVLKFKAATRDAFLGSVMHQLLSDLGEEQTSEERYGPSAAH